MRIESALAHIPEPQQTEVKKILYGINLNDSGYKHYYFL
jgi:hypothetical protein